MRVYRSWEAGRHEPGWGLTIGRTLSSSWGGSPLDCSRSWPQADFYQSGPRADPQEIQRRPTWEVDQCTVWSLPLLQRSLHAKGFVAICPKTIRLVLQAHGWKY